MKLKTPVAVAFLLAAACGGPQLGPLGLFTGHGDVGTVKHPGKANFDGAAGTYSITGSGGNIWAETDQFQYLWKQVSGDVTLTADIKISGAEGNEHRKAVLMIRQDLETDSAYADAALHGNGLTSLQSRDEKGATTHEIESSVNGPTRLRIEKRGDFFYMSVAKAGEDLKPSGGALEVKLTAPFYVGLAVCAHDADATETAVFSNVTLEEKPQSAASDKGVLWSTLETVAVESTERRAQNVSSDLMAAPNWMPDESILFARGGKLWRVDAAGGEPAAVSTGDTDAVTHHFGISPDGQTLAFSSGDGPVLYTMPMGGKPTRLAEGEFSGWSPDSKTILFSAVVENNADVYAVAAAGGEPARLTTDAAQDGGAGFAPDGKTIYFHSDRSGIMEVWKMTLGGSVKEQVTDDKLSNWYPHVSPDGASLVFLSGRASAPEAPRNEDIQLRVMSLGTDDIRFLARMLGGAGTLEGASWSPNGQRLAYVSYQYMP